MMCKRVGPNKLTHWKIYYYSIEIKYFGGDSNTISTFTIIPHFYVSKMTVAIAFLCGNAVEAI